MKRWGVAFAVLAAILALPSLLNGFVYDDVPIIVENVRVHQLGAPGAWTSSYWPVGGLYRPLTLLLFSVEWAIGAGGPFVFHLVSVLLLAVTTALVWRLATRLLPLPGAAAATILFALHPVHVEASASVVGQSELLAASFALLAVERYLAWREQGVLGTGRRLLLAVMTLAAISAKETGYIIPLLLAAAEICRPRIDRRGVGAVFTLQAGVVVSALLVRLIALGTLAGETPSAAFHGISAGERVVGMLQVVPQWTRLLFFPAKLQAEYGPPGLLLDAPFGPAHLLGIALLLSALALAVASWRRDRTITLAFLWIGIALLPVSNLAAAAGLVLGERTLFLPSVGAVLLLGALIAAGWQRVRAEGRAARVMISGLAAALLLAAAWQNISRQGVWRSEAVFFARMAADAPRTYRAHLMKSRYLYDAARLPEAEAAARTALSLFRNDPRVHEQLGQILRVQGRCDEALPVLAEGVERFPDGTTVRSRLIECELAVGDTAKALEVAEDAVALGYREFESTLRRLRPPLPEPPQTR